MQRKSQRDRRTERHGETGQRKRREREYIYIYVQAIYKLLPCTFQMLQLFDSDEETVEVCKGEKAITRNKVLSWLPSKPHGHFSPCSAMILPSNPFPLWF